MLRTSKTKGFTLIELIVTVVVIGIIAALAVPTFRAVQARSLANAVHLDGELVLRNAQAIAASGAESFTLTVDQSHLLTAASESTLEAYAPISQGRIIIAKTSGSLNMCVTVAPNPGFVSEAFDCSSFYVNGSWVSAISGPSLPLISSYNVVENSNDTFILILSDPWGSKASAVAYEASSGGQVLFTWNAPSTSTTQSVSEWADGTYDIQIRALLNTSSYTDYTSTGVLSITVANGAIVQE